MGEFFEGCWELMKATSVFYVVIGVPAIIIAIGDLAVRIIGAFG